VRSSACHIGRTLVISVLGSVRELVRADTVWNFVACDFNVKYDFNTLFSDISIMLHGAVDNRTGAVAVLIIQKTYQLTTFL